MEMRSSSMKRHIEYSCKVVLKRKKKKAPQREESSQSHHLNLDVPLNDPFIAPYEPFDISEFLIFN